MALLVAYNAALLREPYSGVEQAIDATARALAEHGALSYRIYAPAAGIRPLPSGARCAQVPIPAFGWRGARIWWEQTRLPRRLRRDGAAVLHAPAYVAPWRAPCPVVLTVHDLHVFTHPDCCSPLNRLHYRLFMPLSIRRAAAIVVYSEHVRRALLARFPGCDARLHVIPPGVPPPCERPPTPAARAATRARLDLPPRYLLFVGDLTPRKNLPGVLATLTFLRQDKAAATPPLLIAGAEAALRGADVLRLARLMGVADKVRMLGYVAPEDMPALYAEAAMLLYPSLDEGCGLPVLEAMACGCPVICSPGGSAETGGAAVRVCDPREPAQIAARAAQLLSNPDRRGALIAAGTRRVAAFSWQRAVAALDALYGAVAREARESAARRA